jgi:hypothetical protein
MDLMKQATEYLASRYESGFWRSWSWQAASGGLSAAFGPDVVNLVIERWAAIALLPTFGLRAKFVLCVGALVAVVLLRPIQQRNMPAKVEPVARFYVPRVVQLATPSGGRVDVAAQVVPVEAHDPVLDDPVQFARTASAAGQLK